jgi:signal transduction histidine kinase
VQTGQCSAAVKDGERVLTISSGVCRESAGVEILVEDSGPGIEAAGLRMRLAICQLIVEAHQGSRNALTGRSRGAAFPL